MEHIPHAPRNGPGIQGKQPIFPHDDLVVVVKHDLNNDNGCFSAGHLWVHNTCMPMGTPPFFAQDANHHLVWGAYKGRRKFRQLGRLEISTPGWLVRHGPYGCLSVCQSRDNIMVATDASPRDRSTVFQMVWEVLRDHWTLDVDCDCILKTVSVCTRQCRKRVTKAVGVVMVLNSGNYGTAFAEPAALMADRSLKLGLKLNPLKSPRYAPKDDLLAIFTRVLKNSLCWAETWVSQILRAAA